MCRHASRESVYLPDIAQARAVIPYSYSPSPLSASSLSSSRGHLAYTEVSGFRLTSIRYLMTASPESLTYRTGLMPTLSLSSRSLSRLRSVHFPNIVRSTHHASLRYARSIHRGHRHASSQTPLVRNTSVCAGGTFASGTDIARESTHTPPVASHTQERCYKVN